MEVAIIGAGFGGLAAANKLSKAGIDVTVFEKESKPGGLAVGFKEPSWKWPLEEHYHHWFTSDDFVLNLAKEIGHKVIFVRPKTSTYYNSKISQLDSPLSLLQFNELSLANRLRTAAVIAYLKLTPFWKPLENVTAEKFLRKYMGEKSWKVLWQPLFKKKFADYEKEISAAWFWARIKKRSASLSYPVGGFSSFADDLASKIERSGGNFYFNTTVEIVGKAGQYFVLGANKKKYKFDQVICTLPTTLFLKIVDLPKAYKKGLVDLEGIGAINLVVSLKKQFFENGTYWLSVSEMKFPFVAIVEHTNFMDKINYNNENLLYVANYLAHDHKYFEYSANQLLKEFWPALKKINPRLKKDWVNRLYAFKGYFAQPIFPLGYSKIMPDLRTPIDGLYLANTQQVYPWDRGTNYAVELGEKVAGMVLKSE